VNKIAVVTGASRGIGRSIADNLVQNGHRVIYADIIKAEGLTNGNIHIFCDISSQIDRERLLAETLERFGQVDLLINNAGVAPLTRLDILETTTESFQRLMNINLEGTFFMCQIFANQLAKQRSGRIVNISSISSYTSSVNRGEYCISKAGVSMVTRLFADRMAEYNVGVFEVKPGIINTDMTAGVQEKYKGLIEKGLTPIKRMGEPQDVADVVNAIAAGHFDFCTGQVFNADGGYHIRRL